MLSGTAFVFADWDEVMPLIERRALRACTVAELDDVASECRNGGALCLRSPDGVVVVELKPQGAHLELFVRLAVGICPGAFGRAEAGLVLIAQELSAQSIAFCPSRSGWKRLLSDQWLKRGDQYVRPLHGSTPDAGTAQAAR